MITQHTEKHEPFKNRGVENSEGENAPGDDKGHDNIYPISDTENLPPLHPNCRCSATYIRANLEDED